VETRSEKALRKRLFVDRLHSLDSVQVSKCFYLYPKAAGAAPNRRLYNLITACSL
jgi:hypothetical protein